MALFAWIVIAGSSFAAGWYARGLWDFWCAIDLNAEYTRVKDENAKLRDEKAGLENRIDQLDS